MEFKIEEVPGKEISITEKNESILTYCYDDRVSCSYFHPLYAPNGETITETCAEKYLPGLCFSLGTVYDTTEEQVQLLRNKPTLEWKILDSSEECLMLISNTMWKGSDIEIAEKCSTTVHSSQNNARILDINIVLQTYTRPITFVDDLGLGYYAAEMEHRKTANSDGRLGETEVNQQPSQWATLCGIISNTTVGLAILPHPTNGQTFFLAEDIYQGYLLARTPHFTLNANTKQTLKYRVVIYVGDLFTIDLSEYYDNYIT